ncbi:S8 family serine peptidase [Galbitalea soli]|uniref:S8 family serine peptidase n=1 Tax=Galbitalea soli TaxID=1268042 RepID=UPI00179B48E5|nr:subtilisin family serine protease [Galbitalea soli]
MTRWSRAAAIVALVAAPVLAAPPAQAAVGHPVAVGHLAAVGQGVLRTDYIRDGEYWLDQYGIRQAWATTRGKGVTIAVIDTGVDGSVPDLTGAVVGGVDFSGLGASNGQLPVGTGDSDHATMVASLAAGRGTGADSGVIGSAPEASILSISIGFGAGSRDSDTQVAEAVTWAVDHGARVINMSLTRNTLSWPTSWDTAFLYAMKHNVVIVAAAGNRGSGTTEVGAPATMPGVLTVAGVDRNRTASLDASSQGITIGVSAPSEQLLGAVPGGGYVEWAGTSGATPIVSGIVALVMAAHPTLDAANVINRIVATATPAGAPGVDPIYGFGLVNANAAVTATVPKVAANPMGNLAAWIHLNRRAQSTATPTVPPTAQPTSAASGAAAVTGPQNPLGILYPTANQLRDVGLPLGVVSVFGVAALLMMVAAVRNFRSLRRRD